MKREIIICATTWALANPAVAAAPLPADVKNFIESREDCDTLRGEDPTTMASEEEVDSWAAETNKTCEGLDKRLLHLRKKYIKHSGAIDALSSFELIISEELLRQMTLSNSKANEK